MPIYIVKMGKSNFVISFFARAIESNFVFFAYNYGNYAGVGALGSVNFPRPIHSVRKFVVRLVFRATHGFQGP